MTNLSLFPNDQNATLKTTLVHNVIGTVEKLLREPNSSEDGHFGVAAELANAYTRPAILREGICTAENLFLTLSDDDAIEISATAGALLDQKWRIVVEPV